MSKTEQALEFNSETGIAIAMKAVKACKSLDDLRNVFTTRPGNVGHKVIVNLFLGRTAQRERKSKE